MIWGTTAILVILAGFLVAGAIGYAASLFNSLVQVRNNIGKAWKNIDVLLLQRNEELPKLIELTKAYVAYERETLEKLVRLRGLYGQVRKTEEKTHVENDLADGIRELRRVWEGYPGLKANQLFLSLQERISELESMIADRRDFFNETVKIYNIQIAQVPQVLFARMLGYAPHPYLDVPAKGKDG
jgi:LemA protein